ncbi:MAG: hypothetical protein Kow00108_11020 [Calditrichia bacterium]
MAGNIQIIQPAQAGQVSVEKIFQTRPHQPEVEQRHVQEEIKKANEKKREETQDLKKTDQAIIREKKKEQQQKKKKKELAKKLAALKEEDQSGEKEVDGNRRGLDIRI